MKCLWCGKSGDLPWPNFCSQAHVFAYHPFYMRATAAIWHVSQALYWPKEPQP